MKLYGVKGWGSAIAEGLLALANQRYDLVDVEGFDAPSPARDMLLAINPLAQVPTLVMDDGEIFTETAALALYLFGADAPPGVSPKDQRRYLRLLIWLVANVYATFPYADYPERWSTSAPEELRDAVLAHRTRLYHWLEAQITGPFVFGETLSPLDVYLAVMLAWRPRQAWFEVHTPKIAAAGLNARRHPALAAVMRRNGLLGPLSVPNGG